MFKVRKLRLNWVIGILLVVIPISHSIYYSYEKSQALKKASIVLGKVESIEHTRGPVDIYVNYLYRRHLIHGLFGTYDLKIVDSLKPGIMVLLKVSNSEPNKYIEYISVKDTLNNN